MGVKRRAAIHTLGCRVNQAESALLADELEANGYTLLPFGQPVDLGIIHTCTVTREADAKSRKIIRQFIRKNPDALVAVIGCYAQMDPEVVSSLEGVDVVIGNASKLDLLRHLPADKQPTPLLVRDPLEGDDFSLAIPAQHARHREHRANLKIQDGCNCGCSYCIVPLARGRVRSRIMDNLMEEAEHLTERGVKEIVLAGINVGMYQYQGLRLADVADRLNSLPGLRRIRIGSLEPQCVQDALLERMADPGHKLAPYLHIPLQSASSSLLSRMRRNHTREALRALMERISGALPRAGLGTDLMVGFPGETEEEFEETCEFFEEAPFFYAHVFCYSERPGTPAASLPGKIPPAVAEARSARLRALSLSKTEAFGRRHVGKTVEVLFESREAHGWTGYTDHYLRVAVSSEENLENTQRPVILERAVGELVFGRLAE